MGLLPRRHRASELGVGLDGLKESFRCVGNNCARSSDAASGEKKEPWLARRRSAMLWSNGRVSAGGGGRVAASFPISVTLTFFVEIFALLFACLRPLVPSALSK